MLHQSKYGFHSFLWLVEETQGVEGKGENSRKEI